MYQVKVFTGPTPADVEDAANIWLRSEAASRRIRLVQVTSTDTIQMSPSSGIQRFTLVVVYEVR